MTQKLDPGDNVANGTPDHRDSEHPANEQTINKS